MSRITQKDIVLSHLKREGSITVSEAMKYKVFRLADVIFKLKALGHTFNPLEIRGKNSVTEGDYCTTKYVYIGGPEPQIHVDVAATVLSEREIDAALEHQTEMERADMELTEADKEFLPGMAPKPSRYNAT